MLKAAVPGSGLKMTVLHFYQREADGVVGWNQRHVGRAFPEMNVQTESCFNVEWSGPSKPRQEELAVLHWLFSSPFHPEYLNEKPFLVPGETEKLVEIGPRLNFSTAWSTNAVSICHSVGLKDVSRIELSRRYLIKPKIKDEKKLTDAQLDSLVHSLFDRMTECIYSHPIESFAVDAQPQKVFQVDVLGKGRAALEKANEELGLAFDSWDLDYYTDLFLRVQRNPTSVECFDLAQSNSEHSRHWFFRGRMKVDGMEKRESLFNLIMGTQRHSNQNNVIKFCDNSSGIEGCEVEGLYPCDTAQASHYERVRSTRHIIFTAETHNFPTGVAPFSGATTGTGGRIRDVQCTGRGAHVIAGTAGYCFGNLHIPGHTLPWEDATFEYPSNFALPLQVAIEASNGASDYGNKFGEPVLAGFARSFGMRLPNGERREWIKPIMFSGGIGSIEDRHVSKEAAEPGMEVVKIGGPVYRIGVGGGAASSIQVQGDNSSDLDFGAVQRGDAEMEQKMNRALRACIERRAGNPVCSIHDQGAGGNGNVLKELSEPSGAIIYASRLKTGDPTLSALEIWGAEYQESNALLMRPADCSFLRRVCEREKCPVDFVGNITGDGRIVLVDDREGHPQGDQEPWTSQPVDLQLDWVLGKMPQKEFVLESCQPDLHPLLLPPGLTVRDALTRVLQLPAVASKRYLTNKVDRSVTGLVAQQQCVGPLHTPLADVAVVALSPFGTEGAATAVGEQPIKGLLSAAAGARMAVAEALTNLVFARITDLRDVKCSGNWMWAAKLPGEGAALLEACSAMCDVMAELGIAVDGGKDSLSMAARVREETVKAPGSLVISTYAMCPDITATVTPDLKHHDGTGVLLFVPLTPGQHRLGGSALAQCFSQLGDQTPDLDHPDKLVSCFEVTQRHIQASLLSSGHDISDGGLITCLLEMAFAGNCGIEVELPPSQSGVLEVLFSEEPGLVLEVQEAHEAQVTDGYRSAGLTCLTIGRTCGSGPSATIRVCVCGQEVLSDRLASLRGLWESTSFQLERLQANPVCVQQEERGLQSRSGPDYKVTFDPAPTTAISRCPGVSAPRVAVLREEGSNGDREMAAALLMAGFEVWDVTTQDLCSGPLTLDHFRGLVFVGGFSYADVLGSAKGWAATVTFNPRVRSQFAAFHSREDTFSLGVCNGCQLMALLGWVGCAGTGDSLNRSAGAPSSSSRTLSSKPAGPSEASPGVVLTHNQSGRFESRFVAVSILPSPAVMLRGMEGSTLGVWVAHGEGYMNFRSPAVLEDVEGGGLAPLRYVDDCGSPTETYPLNPNGSPRGIAGLCSDDGRHLAMMPHPERTVLTWQWPWLPAKWRGQLTTSPWLTMFQNAATWCLSPPDSTEGDAS
ncbi:phosphoribosylformylglycinamidine synthase isoform X1 [Erpetoichthys calabaricus]|uniref:phosphoribosylformylglycinamidine synthase isoform X1 n=2 Tax=Erpetoichthys calabaricus TaxID=27687 RepID=UPI0022347D10|nr:phosphoribosylformylglycinamidine synthase isoform X1 [Erpetoichthys calabaricus]